MESNSTANLPSALAAIPPPVTGDRKELTNRRVRTAADVIGAWSAMWTADLERSRDRALCQSAVDGAPPYSDARGRANGVYGRSNFNPGLARRSTFKEESPYNELLEQMDIFISTPTKFGDDDQRNEWEPIIAEEFTSMLRKWPQFNYLWQYNVSIFVREGVSVACWEDENNWQWQVYGQQYFKFPEGSKPSEDALDMVGWKSRENCRDLYRKIQNPEIAKKLGWKEAAVTAALKQATALSAPGTDFDYEAWQKRWKANEVLDGARAPQVECVNLLVREIDGSVTHLVAPKSVKEGEDELMYEHTEYGSMSRFMTLFTYGVGTNGDIHSIRGHTSRIFNAATTQARTLNAFADMAMFAATPHLETADEDAMQTIPFRRAGWMTLVQRGNKFLDKEVPPFQENLIPLHSVLTQLMEGESSGASMLPATPMERKTNQQETNERMAEGQLTTSAMALFFPKWEKHLQEVMRRVKRRGYRRDEPGGELVWWLRNRLKLRGVPLEALYNIDVDGMEVNSGVGKGSQLARLSVAKAVMEEYYLLDDKGQNEALRLLLSTLTGSRKANQLAPQTPGQRPGQQVENAIQQNGLLVGKNPAQIASVRILPDQNSVAHAKTHLEFLSQLWPMTQDQDQKGALETIQPLFEHTVDDWMDIDPKNPLKMTAKKDLAEMSEWVLNTAKEIAAAEDRERDKAAKEGGGQPGVGDLGPSMSNFGRAVDAKAKLDYETSRNAMKLDHEKQMLAIRRASAIQDMQLKNVAARERLAQTTQAAS